MSIDPYVLAGIDLFDFIDRPAWMADALCREYPHLSWFPERGESVSEQKAVCARCAVRSECFDAAMANHEDHGIWGGTSARNAEPFDASLPDLPDCIVAELSCSFAADCYWA